MKPRFNGGLGLEGLHCVGHSVSQSCWFDFCYLGGMAGWAESCANEKRGSKDGVLGLFSGSLEPRVHDEVTGCQGSFPLALENRSPLALGIPSRSGSLMGYSLWMMS